MHVLALDTATTDLVVGVVSDGEVVVSSTTATRAHNELLVPETERLLGEAGLVFADLDAVVVGCGPCLLYTSPSPRDS